MKTKNISTLFFSSSYILSRSLAPSLSFVKWRRTQHTQIENSLLDGLFMKKYPLSSGYFLLSTLKRLERAAAFYRKKNINFAAMVKTRRSVGNNDANHTSPTTPSSSSSSANEKIDEFDYTQDPLLRRLTNRHRSSGPSCVSVPSCARLWAGEISLFK